MSNRRKVILAIVGSLVVHLLFVLSWVGYNTIFPPPPVPVGKDTPEDQTQLTLVDPPQDQQDRPYVRTEDDQKTDQKHDQAPFQSDKDTAAASENEAKGTDPVPTQDGKKLDGLMFRNNDFSLADQGSDFSRTPGTDGGTQAPSPEPTPTPTPTPETTPSSTPSPESTPTPQPTPSSTPKPEDLQLAMLESKPTPAPTPQPNTAQKNVKPGAPKTAYRPQSIINRMQGNISNRGRSSVSALGTPQGRFQKAVEDAIGSRWYAYVNSRADLVEIGTVRIEFKVSPSGKVQNARIISNTSNQTLGTTSLQSILDANIPPMPAELAPLVPGSGMDFTFSFNYM
jgi:outer membrane biosynthesis protein TonB